MVYPRWRGELHDGQAITGMTHGLSPLARGTQYAFNHCQAYFRFIPAGAGNSLADGGFFKPEAVYPRWRGELSAIARKLRKLAGLSPLARGTRICRR